MTITLLPQIIPPSQTKITAGIIIIRIITGRRPWILGPQLWVVTFRGLRQYKSRTKNNSTIRPTIDQLFFFCALHPPDTLGKDGDLNWFVRRTDVTGWWIIFCGKRKKDGLDIIIFSGEKFRNACQSVVSLKAKKEWKSSSGCPKLTDLDGVGRE